MFFSKRTWALHIKTKTDVALIRAMCEVFKEHPMINIQKTRARNSLIELSLNICEIKLICFLATENEVIKAAIVGRFNRTLNERMWQY